MLLTSDPQRPALLAIGSFCAAATIACIIGVAAKGRAENRECGKPIGTPHL
jgi:hypothetical protein